MFTIYQSIYNSRRLRQIFSPQLTYGNLETKLDLIDGQQILSTVLGDLDLKVEQVK